MAETNWILNLIDRVTAPMKQVMAQVTSTKEAVEDLNVTNELSQKETEAALKDEKENRKQLVSQIREQKQIVTELEKAKENAAPGQAWAKANKEVEVANKNLDSLNKALKGSNEDISQFEGHLNKLKSQKETFSSLALGFNQFGEMLNKVSKSLDFSIQINRTRDNIERMTGASGRALDDVTKKVHVMGRAFNENDDEIALSANTLSRNMGISYNDALVLIEKGFDKGANLNGKMLQTLQQYAPHMREMGLTASQTVTLMADAAKKGIPEDKAIAAFDIANESLRERSPKTIEALEAIGISAEKLKDKTSFEAVQMISQSMKGVSENAKANVLKEVFKTSGKDVGTQFIEGIASVDMDIDKIPSVAEAGTGFQKFLGSLEGWFATAFGNMGTYVSQFAGVAGSLNDVVGIIATLSKFTWAQNVAQNALNITTGIFNVIAKAGPWGWIATAIGAVILVIGYLGDKFEWAAGIMGGIKNSFMDFGKVLLDWVLLPIKSILAGLGAMGSAIAKLFSGDFSGAWTAAKSALDPIKELVNDTKTAAGSYQKGSDDAIAAMRKKKADEAAGLASADGTELAPILGDIPPIDDKKNKSKSKSDGMSISGAGGTKAITMNLEIKNYFNNVKGNVREMANQIAGQVNDRLRDALVTN